MHEYQNRSDTHQKGEQENYVGNSWNTGIMIAVWLFIGAFFLLRLYVYDRIPGAPERTAVLIESMFSLAVVIVIVIHAVMYYKQAKAMNAQLEVSGMTLITSNQAYVGIHSIADRDASSGRVILITLENIGRVPADEITINIHLSGLLLDRDVTREGVRPNFTEHTNEHFGRTKLFPGNLKIEIALPYDKYVSNPEYVFIRNNRMAFYVWGKIVYKDGFGEGKVTEFSFHYSKTGRWMVAAPWSPNVVEMLERERSHKHADYQKAN